MRKFIALSALTLAAFTAVPAMADHDIQTDRECAESTSDAPATVTVLPMAHGEDGNPEALRGSLCVSDNDASNGAELYIGGEIDTESSYDITCGAIEVLGRQGTGTGLLPVPEGDIFGYDNWDDTDCQ